MTFISRMIVCGILLHSLTTPVLSAEQATANAGASLDEVLVTGEQPGPGMWRVSRNGHDLWVLATLRPLPKNMTWRSLKVEQRITNSQGAISLPQVDAEIGFFRGLTLIPALLHARKSPDGRVLEQILPHELYIRWLALRVKYLGSAYDEHRRPILAASDLYDAAIANSGLTDNEAIWEAIKNLVHKDRVPLQSVLLKIKVDDAKGAVHDLGKIPQDVEIDCLAKTVERLETDLQPMRQRANLWSLGDIDSLLSLTYPDEEVACLNAVLTVPEIRDQYERARSQLSDLWLTTAESTLEKNVSTFAVLPMSWLLKQDGVLDRLKRRGYEVQEPT
jgi:hypothetical protein